MKKITLIFVKITLKVSPDNSFANYQLNELEILFPLFSCFNIFLRRQLSTQDTKCFKCDKRHAQ